MHAKPATQQRRGRWRVWAAIWLSALASVLTALSLRVGQREGAEQSHIGPMQSLQRWQRAPGATRISARLGRWQLPQGAHVSLQICLHTATLPQRWPKDGALLFWAEGEGRPLIRLPFSALAHAATPDKAPLRCLPLGQGTLPQTGHYALDTVWPHRDITPQLRALSVSPRLSLYRPLRAVDRLGLLVLALVALAGAITMALQDRRPATATKAAKETERHDATQPSSAALDVVLHAPPRRRPAVVLAGIGLTFAALWWAHLHLPWVGALAGLLKGGAMALLQASLAGIGLLWLGTRTKTGTVPRAATSTGAVAASSPLRRWLGVLTALATGALVHLLARRALCLWPPDGSSPIEAFVAWPSGTLAFATLGLLLPLSEELFFRGFVYHAVERLAGAWPAALLSTLAFVLLHLQQVWGNWGALVGIVLLSCACSLLRLVSGHWSVAAVAHLSYNGWLVWRSMA